VISSPSPDQRSLAELLRRFLAEASPSSEVRRAMETETGYDAALWKRMSEELGLPGVAVAEDCGGQGLGIAELALACRELGRPLACSPFFATVVLAGSAVAHAARGAARREREAAIAAGETFALAASADRGESPLEAVRSSDGWRVAGVAGHVVDGHSAQRVIAIARTPGAGDGALGIFEVDGDARELARARLRSFDRTRPLARLAFDGASARPLGEPGDDRAAIERALEVATALTCAEMLGGLEQVLEAAVAYARERTQFGRAIGSFQAIKHKAADVAIALEATRSLVDGALEAAAPDALDDARSLALEVSAAKSYASDAYVRGARENVQIHGGIGFTWEHDAHLYLRRATSSAALLGSARWHRERLAALAFATRSTGREGAHGGR